MGHDSAHSHNHGDDHGHGHGHGAAPAWDIIAEDSAADKTLIALAFSSLIGLFFFAFSMFTAPHHGGEHDAASSESHHAVPQNEHAPQH